ncbi:MAG: flagellin [Succinivibrio sp.]|jgi:flagellin|nr:flagellin [Succinivibrio sp.]
MALYLTNVTGMKALAAFGQNQAALSSVYERLSSGLRINSARDDPAGLQIADRMTTEINGFRQGSRNVNDGISVAQTAEGALDEIKSMLQRVRTLAVQAANGTNTSSDRAALSAESRQLCAEITRIACRTTYAGARLLCGVDSPSSERKLFDSHGQIRIQVSGHAGDTIAITGLSAGFTFSALAMGPGYDAQAVKKGDESNYFDLGSAESSQAVLKHIDKAINKVSMAQGTLGGVQQRFESVLRLNDTMRNNLSDARSRIQDTDYAEEASNLAKAAVLAQIMPAILKQIYQQKSLILSLLQG